MGFDPNYEHTRTPSERKLYFKIWTKRALYKTVGEPYIGRRVKLRYLKRLLRQIEGVGDKRVLDVGSGDGLFAFYVAAEYRTASVVGLELNNAEVQICGRIARKEGLANLEFIQGTPETYRGEPFDLVYCLDVLEHITDDLAAVRAMRDIMRPGGLLLVHVPSRYYLGLDGILQTVPDEEAWKINPGHVRNGYTPDELRNTIESAGLVIDAIVPTQGLPIDRGFRIYNFVERFWPLRILILPIIDYLTWKDMRHAPPHGNTVWAIARRVKDGPGVE